MIIVIDVLLKTMRNSKHHLFPECKRPARIADQNGDYRVSDLFTVGNCVFSRFFWEFKRKKV